MLEGQCHCQTVRWRFQPAPKMATACNCTVCRRYGALWAYGHEDEEIKVSGPTRAYIRGDGQLAFHFCENCACVAYWRALAVDEHGRRRIGVNLRLAELGAVRDLPVNHFDGLNTFTDLGRDGRCVKDLWF